MEYTSKTRVAVLVLALSSLNAALCAGARTRILSGKYVDVEVGTAECDVTSSPYNAKGDGKTNDTAAVQMALDKCGGGDGGKVTLPTGKTFLISALVITQNHTELHIASGSTILVSTDFHAFPQGVHIINANKVTDIAITGGGTVDGQGLVWWREMKKPGMANMWRPHTVQFSDVTRGLFTDTLYINGPNHILELGCDFCELSHIKVLNPSSTGDCANDNSCSHNTDAVDIHGDPFWVHDVNFTTGDDNIASHANNTLVEDSYFGTGHGASIGSLCDNWLQNITFRNITFHGTTAAARIKAHPKCAGHVWNVTYEDLTMDNVASVIQLTMFYQEKAPFKYKTSTMRFTNIVFRNLVATKSGSDGNGKDAFTMECDTTFDSHGGGNCDVVVDNVAFPDQVNNPVQMECTGAFSSSVKDLVGVHSCLKPPPQ
eukprot:m.105415 g.105415  ORF g.105415 m.105415 type:complete len:430 (-) comp27645_c0_seq2:249-1538(-)